MVETAKKEKMIRIDGLPPSDLIPDYVDVAAIGLELKVSQYVPTGKARRVDIFGGDELQHVDGYDVDVNEFLDKLKARSRHAEQWYRNRILLHGAIHKTGDRFGKSKAGSYIAFITFGKEFCTEID